MIASSPPAPIRILPSQASTELAQSGGPNHELSRCIVRNRCQDCEPNPKKTGHTCGPHPGTQAAGYAWLGPKHEEPGAVIVGCKSRGWSTSTRILRKVGNTSALAPPAIGLHSPCTCAPPGAARTSSNGMRNGCIYRTPHGREHQHFKLSLSCQRWRYSECTQDTRSCEQRRGWCTVSQD